jgi:hypothetical protein
MSMLNPIPSSCNLFSPRLNCWAGSFEPNIPLEKMWTLPDSDATIGAFAAMVPFENWTSRSLCLWKRQVQFLSSSAILSVELDSCFRISSYCRSALREVSSMYLRV